MHNVLVPTTRFSLDRSMAAPATMAPTSRHPCAPQRCTDEQFVAMLNGYRGSGGLAREESVLALYSRRGGFDAATLANWIAAREVIGFEWESRTWIPIFQFNLVDMMRPPALGPVLAELVPVYDSWELASWFALPNSWLGDRVPVDALEHDPSAVLQAARADRFIADT